MRIIARDIELDQTFKREDARETLQRIFPNGGETIDKLASLLITNDPRATSYARDQGLRVVLDK